MKRRKTHTTTWLEGEGVAKRPNVLLISRGQIRPVTNAEAFCEGPQDGSTRGRLRIR